LIYQKVSCQSVHIFWNRYTYTSAHHKYRWGGFVKAPWAQDACFCFGCVP